MKAARLMRRVTAELTAHVGGRPSATQRMLISRAATLSAYVARLDGEALSPDGLSDHRRREYLAADASLRRTLREIGLKGTPERAPTLAEYLAGKAAAPPASTPPAASQPAPEQSYPATTEARHPRALANAEAD